MRILNIISGVLLIVAGIYCLCNQDVAAMTAGVMVGVFMLISGVIEIIVFASTSGLLFGSGWLLLDGVLTVILSLFLLFNQWFTLLSLPLLFTLWLLFSGISRFVSASALLSCWRASALLSTPASREASKQCLIAAYAARQSFYI